jgi:peptidoglycan pentaglycine glycine transferase (the first glycine)
MKWWFSRRNVGTRMAAYKVIAETADPGAAWDRFVSESPMGHLMQSRAWAFQRRDTGWHPVFLRLEDGGVIRAAAVLLRRGLRRVGLSLLYMPRGPVLDYSHTTLVTEFGAALRRVAEEHGAFLIQTDPAVPQENKDAHQALEKMGFVRQEKHGLFRISQPLTVMRIPLERYGSPDVLLAALPHKSRYNIGLAQRRGVTVVPRTDHDACRIFHRLLWQSGRAKRFAVRGLAFHEAIWKQCVQAGLGEYLFAFHEDQLLAAIQVLWFGKRAWYMYGASTGDEQQLMPAYLLQWTAITRAWNVGCRCYDMRGIYSATPNPKDPEYGVYEFKRRCNAEIVTFLGEYDLIIRHTPYAAWRRIEHGIQAPVAWGYRLWQGLRPAS